MRTRHTPIRVVTGSRQNATRGCEERDKAVRTGREIATERSSRSKRDGFAVATRPQNAAYRAVAFTRGIGLARFGYGLTHLWSTSSGWFVQVAADEKGKKNGLVWTISCSPAAMNSPTRPQQDVNSSPRVW
ncbi:hypothetical protein Taro_017445 [Colocasia esculenta]|uniref:Uncharacterized protein n=1 Tax=Colocasia esculenta TaxID=4460 RepID=A0A843UT73_COLES|nr:hypothetical protein [Colocasia esculenta]